MNWRGAQLSGEQERRVVVPVHLHHRRDDRRVGSETSQHFADANDAARPAVAAGQLRRNQMKLAMVVGKNRHAGMDRIAARHFVQTGEENGMGASASPTRRTPPASYCAVGRD